MFVNSYLFPMFGHFFFKFVFGIIVWIWIGLNNFFKTVTEMLYMPVPTLAIKCWKYISYFLPLNTRS